MKDFKTLNNSIKENDILSYRRLISDMITDPEFSHRSDFLKSLREQIDRHGKLSEKQKTSVNNIYIRGGKR